MVQESCLHLLQWSPPRVGRLVFEVKKVRGRGREVSEIGGVPLSTFRLQPLFLGIELKLFDFFFGYSTLDTDTTAFDENDEGAVVTPKIKKRCASAQLTRSLIVRSTTSETNIQAARAFQ